MLRTLFLTIFLVGCAGQYYAPPGVSQHQANMDHAECKQQALQYQRLPSGYGNAQGGFYGGLNTQMPSIASNIQASQAYNNCMEMRGYSR